MDSSRDPQGGVIKTDNQHYHTVFEFTGRTLIGTTQLDSGARRITVNFDDSFRSCAVDVVWGKEGANSAIVGHGFTNQIYIASQVKASSPSCAVTDGNIFGGQAD